MTQRLAWLFAVVVLTVAGCGGGGSTATPVFPQLPPSTPPSGPSAATVGSIELYELPPLRPSWSARLDADVLDPSGKSIGDSDSVAWASSNPSVASISSSNVLRANAVGETTVTAAAGGVVASMVIKVTADAMHKFYDVSAGGRHTCATAAAGPPVCWGSNASGQLGNGTGADSAKPVDVAGAIGQRYDGFVSTPYWIAAGAGFTCAWDYTALGQYCWGDNASGQAGDGTQLSRVLPSLQTMRGLYSISTGVSHACAITNGRSYCWGSNDSGQLGTGTHSSSLLPVGVVFADPRVASALLISAGRAHTCGRFSLTSPPGLDEFATYCWGSNASGQLGTGGFAGAAQPTKVGSDTFSSTVMFINAGYDHTCAVTGGNVLYCWGDNTHGQLGNGTRTGSNVPSRVTGGLSFNVVDAGASHTCAIAVGGAAYCWGSNSNGQLGDGSTADSTVPVAVAGGLQFSTISTGVLHTCGVTRSAGVYCWGANADGQLGDGTTTDRATPVKVVDFQ